MHITIENWSNNHPQWMSHHELMNSNALAQACLLENNRPFSLQINGNCYLSIKRHCSLTIGALSLTDFKIILGNMSLLKKLLLPLGINALSLNTWNASEDKESLRDSINDNSRLRFEFLLDTESYNINKISSNHRRNIKKAEKLGAVCSIKADLSSLQDHIKLVNENLADKGIGGLSNSPKYFHSLTESNSGMLIQVNHNKELLASTFFIMNNDYLYYHSSGTNDKGKHLGAAHFLVNYAIQEMKKKAIRYLNLGGCLASQTGLIRFKQGFKPEAKILLSAHRSLSISIRRKIWSSLSVRKKDLIQISRVRIYSKKLGNDNDNFQSDYYIKKIGYDGLYDTVLEMPELARNLYIFCRPSHNCFCLYNNKNKIIGMGFIETSIENQQSLHNIHSYPDNVVEITHIYVCKQSRGMGLGVILFSLLQKEAKKMGFDTVYARISSSNLASINNIEKLDYQYHGEEKIISTNLFGGKKMLANTINL